LVKPVGERTISGASLSVILIQPVGGKAENRKRLLRFCPEVYFRGRLPHPVGKGFPPSWQKKGRGSKQGKSPGPKPPERDKGPPKDRHSVKKKATPR